MNHEAVSKNLSFCFIFDAHVSDGSIDDNPYGGSFDAYSQPKRCRINQKLLGCFVSATSRLTKEKKLCVGKPMSESLCALILVKNTLLECIEREHQDYKEHYGVAPISKQLCCCLFFGRTILKEERESTRTIRVSI